MFSFILLTCYYVPAYVDRQIDRKTERSILVVFVNSGHITNKYLIHQQSCINRKFSSKLFSNTFKMPYKIIMKSSFRSLQILLNYCKLKFTKLFEYYNLFHSSNNFQFKYFRVQRKMGEKIEDPSLKRREIVSRDLFRAIS